MLSKLTYSSHKIVQLVQLPTFSFKHTTNIYYLADVRLSLFNNIFGHDAMAISELSVKAVSVIIAEEEYALAIYDPPFAYPA